MLKIQVITKLLIIFFIVQFTGCKTEIGYKPFKNVVVEEIYNDSILSVRAIDFNHEYVFYGSQNHFGKIDLEAEFKINTSDLSISNGLKHKRFEFKKQGGGLMSFRAVKQINGDMLALSIESPTRLYKLNKEADKAKLVYEDGHPKAFYDAMNFWNDKEGLAMGDPTEGCLSIIITRDAGESWQKVSCDKLPKTIVGEAAFAASNTNIAIYRSHTWIATGGMASRVLYSPDKGKTWDIFNTPIVQEKSTTGIYSIDFYDESNGFAIGGDYTKPDANTNNKIRTNDGGKTWELIAQDKEPGYRSCVQYVPNSKGKGLVAVGFKGIDFSKDGGETWIHLSDEAFYTIKFITPNEAYAGGNGKIARLKFL